MPNRMHAEWLSAKTLMQKQIDDAKKKGGLNPKQLQEALKSFDQGLGPLLDKTASAYKDKKDADIKKHAAAAVTVADRYLATVNAISNERGAGGRLSLKTIIGKLNDLRAKGSAAPNYFTL